MPEDAERRRMRDLALIVPVLGILMLMPPLVGLFARPDITPFGIPLIIVYLFGLWFALIVMALVLALRLRKTDEAGTG